MEGGIRNRQIGKIPTGDLEVEGDGERGGKDKEVKSKRVREQGEKRGKG